MQRLFGNKLRPFSSRICQVIGAAIVMHVGAAQGWAQVVMDEPPEPRYVLSYVLLFLMIGLAIFGICRPSRRSRDMK